MTFQKKFPLSNRSILYTNMDGIIENCNNSAYERLNTRTLIGHPVKLYLDALTSSQGQIEKLDKGYVFLFGESEIHSDLEHIFNRLETGIFTADSKGNILYHNTAFSHLFKEQTFNVFKAFEHFTLQTQAFELIKHAKKEIVFEIQINHAKDHLLKLYPLFNSKGLFDRTMGFITPNHNTDALKIKLHTLERELSQQRLNDKEASKQHLQKPFLQSHSKPMQALHTLLSNISNKDITLLLLGQSGTGKSTLARRIHKESLRHSKPFVTINCSILPENLIESELFGYEKGAFTGASASGKKGLIELAEGGTLFIDEIGELPLYLQGKLLELLQDRVYRPIGSTQVKKADVRIIVATNKSLAQLVDQKKFRKDLYYRVAVAVLNIPPLSEHPEDISELIDAYSLYFNKKYDLQVQFSTEAKEFLTHYNWPGNIRELEHVVEFLTVRSPSAKVTKNDLPLDILHYNYTGTTEHSKDFYVSQEPISNTFIQDYQSLSFDAAIEKFESELINTVYAQYKSSYKLANQLKISQSKAHRLIQKYCKK